MHNIINVIINRIIMIVKLIIRSIRINIIIITIIINVIIVHCVINGIRITIIIMIIIIYIKSIIIIIISIDIIAICCLFVWLYRVMLCPCRRRRCCCCPCRAETHTTRIAASSWRRAIKPTSTLFAAPAGSTSSGLCLLSQSNTLLATRWMQRVSPWNWQSSWTHSSRSMLLWTTSWWASTMAPSSCAWNLSCPLLGVVRQIASELSPPSCPINLSWFAEKSTARLHTPSSLISLRWAPLRTLRRTKRIC